MGAGVLLTIGSLLYIILLVIVYYSKEKMPTLENKIFKMIMMTSLIGIIIHLFLKNNQLLNLPIFVQKQQFL